MVPAVWPPLGQLSTCTYSRHRVYGGASVSSRHAIRVATLESLAGALQHMTAGCTYVQWDAANIAGDSSAAAAGAPHRTLPATNRPTGGSARVPHKFTP